MASVSASDIPEVQQFMGVYWNTIKKFYGVELTDKYFAEVYDYLNELGQQFPHRLCRKLTLAFAEYIDEEQRDMQQELKRRDAT